MEEITEEKLKTTKRQLFVYDANKIKGIFIFTEEARNRLQIIYNQFQSNNPIMLEGPTGTSKTKTIHVYCDLQNLELIRINLSSETTIEDLMGRLISDKDNSFSGFKYKEGAFADAYSKGKVLLLDEVNLAPNPVLQCMLTALDSDKITQSIPGIGLKTFERHKNFRIVATQNPKIGAFSATRDRLSSKFLETFQVVEFPEFSASELSEIAHQVAKKQKYYNEKVIDQISRFHNEWVKSEFSKMSPQCYTVRDLNISIKSISEGNSPKDVISCFYGSRYDETTYEIMENILKKYPDLYKECNTISDLPDDFPKCFQSSTINKTFQFAKMGVENGKHILLAGEEEIGLTQIAKWISSYFSKNKKENFLFVFTPETTVADLLGRYVPSPQTNEKSNIMNWEDGPLTKAIKEGYSGVFANISSAQTKVAERLNGLFDPKDTEEDYFFDLSENSDNPKIPINKNFLFVSTCNADKLKDLSPALLNRFMVINISNQLEKLRDSDIKKLIKIILEIEYQGEDDIKIDEEIINLIFEKYNKLNLSMAKLTKFSKSIYRVYLECQRKINKKELVDYIENLLFKDKDILFNIPLIIKNKADDLFTKNQQTSSDEKFYFKNSSSLKTLMIHLYVCSICRIPVCLVGPTGLGKTSMARAFSEYIRNEIATMYSFHLETQIDDIYGTFTFQNGLPVIIDGPLTLALKQGKIFIADEFNLAENTILQTLSIAFENSDENSFFLIPGIGSKIKYNKNFFFIACQNDLSTTGRKKLPHVIEKRFRVFEYPFPDLEDLKKSCQDIIKENISEKIEYKTSNAEKMAIFMYKINKLNDPDIGTWSMRNIRKIFRRNAYQQLNQQSYINVSFELQVVIYILGEIPINKREEVFQKIMNVLIESFEMDENLINSIKEVINDKMPRIEARKEYKNKKFLFKGKSGVEIGNEFNGLESLFSFMETVYYAKFVHFKEPINFCGPSSYKTFLAQKFAIGAPVINLYPESSINQLLGNVALVNNMNAKIYYLEEILKICGKEENIKEYKEMIQKYFEIKNKEEQIEKDDDESDEEDENSKKSNHHEHHKEKKEKKKKKESSDDSSDDEDKKKKNIKKISGKSKKILKELETKLIQIIEGQKKKLPECICLSLDSLTDKLFDKEPTSTGLFKDFTSIFKTGILLEKILKQSPLILKNLPNLSTAVLERFNDLFNFLPKLTLNEDFCDTFTGKFKGNKEISNFSQNFRVISVSSLSGIRNLSDAARSRFSTIYTSEYSDDEKEIASKLFNPNNSPELASFIEKYKTTFNTKISFMDIIKILTIFKKFCEVREEKKEMNIMFSIYFSLYLNFETKSKIKKFLDLLREINPKFNDKLNEEDLNTNKPFEIDSSTNIMKSKWTELEIRSGKINEEKVNNICFIKPFNKLLNYIHTSLALNIPLILEGQIGIGKKTAINYISQILGKKVIYFSISNSTTVEDLFCKTIPIQKEYSIEFQVSRSKLLDAIDSSKYDDESLKDCIIIIDNLQQASNNVLESLIPVFDETKRNIFLPNGDIINKGKYNLLAIFDPTYKGNNIKNALPNALKCSSLLYKCDNYMNEKYLQDISDVIFDYNEDEDIKYQKRFIKDFLTIFKYCQENQSKELFTLNDLIKYKKIYEITLRKKIIDYETLIQIILIYRFSNVDDISNIISKKEYSLDRDLWPTLDYTDVPPLDEDEVDEGKSISESENENEDFYIRISPMEKKKYLSHKLSNFDTKMENLKKKMFSLTPQQRLGLIFLMISIKTNLTCIIQGSTASGKSYLIKLFCELLGEEPEIIELNNDSGISLLTGQIAPKSEIDNEDIAKIQKILNSCKHYEKLYSIVNKDNFIDNPLNWKPKDFREILNQLELIKKDLSENELTIVKKIENKFNNELLFLKHLKNEDSTFINALIKGKWVILDGIESAQPELFERLTSLCDINNKSLNLFEKGPEYEYTLDNKNPKFKIHENFRLFITYNPFEIEHSKKLSSSIISKCLTFFLSPIDKDDKSSALILSGLFNYNKIFDDDENNEETNLMRREPQDNKRENKEIIESKNDKNIKDLKKNLKKNEKSKKEKKNKSRNSSSSSEKPKKERKNKSRSSSSSSEKSKNDKKIKSRSSSSSSEQQKKEKKDKSRSSSSSSEKQKKKKKNESRSSSSSSEKSKKEKKKKNRGRGSSSGSNKSNLEKKNKKENIKELKNEKKEVDEKKLEEKRKKMLSIKKFVRELSIKLTNIHLNSKNFAKDKILLFAGQKNFSGRNLIYIYNAIKSRRKNLSEAILSVIEDCYCNSYKNPEEMKQYLIHSFSKKNNNYNEIMNYLRKDEQDTREKYEPLFILMDEYLEKSIKFKFITFLDYFNNVLYKDLKEIRKNIEDLLNILKSKINKENIEYFSFFRILLNILNSLTLKDKKEKLNEKKCFEKKIVDPIISKKLKSIKFGQKKYFLLIDLLGNNMINMKIKFEKYNDYENKIKNNKEIINPYFELFIEKGNLITNSIALSFIYPENADDDNLEEKLKLKQLYKDIFIIITKLINFSEINAENYKENIEVSIIKKLLALSNNKLFNYALDEDNYNQEYLAKLASDDSIKVSKNILSIIISLTEEKLYLDKDSFDYINRKFKNFASKYEDFNSALINANFKKKGEEEKGRIKEQFENLIKKLRKLDKNGEDALIKKAIKYLDKANLTMISLKNAEKYVDCIKDEYENIKSEEGKKRAIIKFDIKPGDYEDNYEPVSNFQKIIKSLIEYTECLNILEKISNNERIMYNLNKLDKMITSVKGKNILKKSFKILRKILIEDEKKEKESFQYFKDILLSKLLQELIQIDESCKYLHIEKILYELNKAKERDSISNDERKYASYLVTKIEPRFEIILPQININSILLLFVQKTYKGKSKPGLFFTGMNKNLFREGKEDFIEQVESFQKADLSKINLIDGLNKLVDIFKNTLFIKDKQITQFLEEIEDKNPEKIIYFIHEKNKEIKLKDTVIKSMISIIKNFYDSFNNFGFTKGISESNILNFDDSIQLAENNLIDKSDEKEEFEKNSLDIEESKSIINFTDKLEYDDLFFIYDTKWKENINNKITKHKYLIYYLFKNPQIEHSLRTNLLETDTFKNYSKTKFPLYVHLLRVFSSKDEMSFQGKSNTYTSNLIEKTLIEKIQKLPKKYFINNIAWVGLLINNASTISNKYIPNKVSYFYNYLCKLGELQFKPSVEFEKKFKQTIEKLINLILNSCLENNIEKIFDLKINDFEEEIKNKINKSPKKKSSKKLNDFSIEKKINENLIDLFEDEKKEKIDEESSETLKDELEEEEKEEINDIHYFVHLNQLLSNELEERNKKGYMIFEKKLREISIEIEPSKAELSKIYEKIINSLNEDKKIEGEKRREKEMEDLNKDIFEKSEELENNIQRYINKYNQLKTVLSKNLFNDDAREILSLNEKLKKLYGNEIFTNEKIEVLEIIISRKYKLDSVKIIPKDGKTDIILLGEKDFKERKFYLPSNFCFSEMILKDEKDKEVKLTIRDKIGIKYINKKEVEKKKIEIQNSNKNIDIKNIDMNIKILISDNLIKKDIEEDKFLLSIKEISDKISKNMKKISDHLKESEYIIKKVEIIKDIIQELSKLSLNDPKIIGGNTELINTKKICEQFQTLKEILIKKFELIRENYLKYDKINKELENDKEGISSYYKLINKLKIVEDKQIDISHFKKNSFNSPYIMLSSDNKTIQVSYSVFNFRKIAIIPSLYANSIFSFNIFSFVNKNLKAEIIKEDILNKDYADLFLIQNYIPASEPIIINFIIPEKKLEEEENVELNPCFKLSDASGGDINPVIIKTNFSIKFLPLRVIIFSDKLNFYWKNERLIIDKKFTKQGHSLKIYLKILDFNGNYEFLENNYSLYSLDNNNVDLPIIKLDKEEKSCAKFKINIPNTFNITENICHGLFYIYISNNLKIPIEISTKIKKNDYQIFYYDKYEDKVKNHNTNKEINIYKYYNNKEIKFKINFQIEYSDKEEHYLDIKYPPYNRHLYFLSSIGSRENIKERKTFYILVYISNYDEKTIIELNKLCSKNLEIEFNSDGIIKKFCLRIKIEDYFAKSDSEWLLSAPFFTYYNKKFTKIDELNYSSFNTKDNFFYFNYDGYYGSVKKSSKNLTKLYPKLSKLIYYYKEFNDEGIVVWDVTDDAKLEEFKDFSYIDSNNENNIYLSKKRISEIYSKFTLFNYDYDYLESRSSDNNMKKMDKLIEFICSIQKTKKEKRELLMDLSQYLPNNEILIEEIKKIESITDEDYLPIVFHNIIFIIGNLFKYRKEELKPFKKDYHSYYQYLLSLKFKDKFCKNFDEKKFQSDIQLYMDMKDQNPEEEEISEESSSKFWQFNEFSKEPPLKLIEIPKTKKKEEKDKENEEILDELKINEDILNNNKIELTKVQTINEIINLFNKSSILIQLFPFLIGKIKNDEIYKLFNNLYSIYISYKRHDKSILSEEIIKYCNYMMKFKNFLKMKKIIYQNQLI